MVPWVLHHQTFSKFSDFDDNHVRQTKLEYAAAINV
jgi:hypothetical protein